MTVQRAGSTPVSRPAELEQVVLDQAGDLDLAHELEAGGLDLLDPGGLTGALLALLRVPHHVSGEQILRTEQTFSVIEACSTG